LQTGGEVVGLFGEHRGAVVASTSLMGPMSKAFVADIHRFAKREGIEIVHVERGQRKDEETQRRLEPFQAQEGVRYIGVAQEKIAGFRVMKKISPHTGTAFPWSTEIRQPVKEERALRAIGFAANRRVLEVERIS
jgi:hypothetical protein